MYDFLKKVVTIVLPAISSAYFALAQIWDFPNPEKVVGTLAILTTFLGTLIGISTVKYNNSPDAFDGSVVITPKEDGGTNISLELNDKTPIDNIASMDQLRFKVQNSQ